MTEPSQIPSLGVAAMDEDHGALDAMLAELGRALEAGGVDDQTAIALVENIGRAALLHFRREEDSMEKTSYEHLGGHRRAHQGLMVEIEGFVSELKCDGLAALDEELAPFLTGWLVTHVVGDDAAYADFLKENGLAF